jgi:hypothetical protein
MHMQAPLTEVLSILDIYRVLIGVAGVLFAIWALQGRPHWVGGVAVAIAGTALLFGFAVRM